MTQQLCLSEAALLRPCIAEQIVLTALMAEIFETLTSGSDTTIVMGAGRRCNCLRHFIARAMTRKLIVFSGQAILKLTGKLDFRFTQRGGVSFEILQGVTKPL